MDIERQGLNVAAAPRRAGRGIGMTLFFVPFTKQNPCVKALAHSEAEYGSLLGAYELEGSEQDSRR